MKVFGVVLAVLLGQAAAPASAGFSDNGDGTITDSKTGLMWQKQGDGKIRNFERATEYCSQLTLAGKTGWRLPKIDELKTLVDTSKHEPTIDTTFFPKTDPWNYWSSSAAGTGTLEAKVVDFGDGSVWGRPKGMAFNVRCVRR